MNNFTTPLRLEYLDDGRRWMVLEPFVYHLGTPDGKYYVRVEPGFITDFASIPRPFWVVLPPTGDYGKPAVIHDALYRLPYIFCGSHCWRYVDRAEADAILKEGMKVLGVSWWARQTIYWGVRTAGWAAWNKYRRQKAKIVPAKK